jgi:hypothetical protein
VLARTCEPSRPSLRPYVRELIIEMSFLRHRITFTRFLFLFLPSDHLRFSPSQTRSPPLPRPHPRGRSHSGPLRLSRLLHRSRTILRFAGLPLPLPGPPPRTARGYDAYARRRAKATITSRRVARIGRETLELRAAK